MGQVPGIGPDKLERYGTDVLRVIREDMPIEAQDANDASIPRSSRIRLVSATAHKSPGVPNATPAREQSRVATPSLTIEQQALESRLRTWRQAASEKMGMPQFFVLGSATLRDIAMAQPQSVPELRSVPGLTLEKIERFGCEILEICRG